MTEEPCLVDGCYYWVRGLLRDKSGWEVCCWATRYYGSKAAWWVIGKEYPYEHNNSLDVVGPINPPEGAHRD